MQAANDEQESEQQSEEQQQAQAQIDSSVSEDAVSYTHLTLPTIYSV